MLPSDNVSYYDTTTLVVLVATILGFMLPMLIVYPPVAPLPSDFLEETHAKVGLETRVPGKKTKDDGSAASDAETGPPRISSLWIYPVKSCAGIRVSRSQVLPTGFAFDRLFTFAQLKSAFPARAGATVGAEADVGVEKEDDGDDGGDGDEVWDFITQRQFPRLATLQVELWRPDLAKAKRALAGMRADDLAAGRAASMRETFVVLRYPWVEKGAWAAAWAWAGAKLARGWRAVPEVEVVLSVSEDDAGDQLAAEVGKISQASKMGTTAKTEKTAKADKPAAKPTAKVRIWGDVVRAYDLSAELPRSLQLYLGVSNRLGVFRIDPENLRQIFRCAPREDVAGYQPVTAFQDAYPVHLLNRSSVSALESEIPEDQGLPNLDERRFRVNIVVSGVPAYDEDSWKTVSFKRPIVSPELPGEAKFHVSCRTVRCKLPNVDPDTGERHPREPDHTLRTTRDIDEGAPRMGCLGMQLTPLFEQPDRPELMELTVEAGMDVDVLERGAHTYIKR